MTLKQAPTRFRQVPRSVWALGLVSMLMDVSSEMIHSLLPVFLVTVVGAGTVTVGLIEGLGEATAAITKVFSGALSDRLGKRKLLAGIGYGLGALTKPMFPLATTAGDVLAARLIDRYRERHQRRAARCTHCGCDAPGNPGDRVWGPPGA